MLANARPQRADGTPGGNQGPGPKQGDPEVVKMFGTGSGRTPKDVIAVQERLCVSPTGNVGKQTRTGIAIYRRNKERNLTENGNAPFLGRNEENEYKTFLGSVANCSKYLDKFMNFYEFNYLNNDQTTLTLSLPSMQPLKTMEFLFLTML